MLAWVRVLVLPTLILFLPMNSQMLAGTILFLRTIITLLFPQGVAVRRQGVNMLAMGDIYEMRARFFVDCLFAYQLQV